jgi:uncharacterized protein
MSARRIVGGAIGVYRRFVSPLLPPSCRYWPSCSEYTAQAVRKYGVVRGGLMGAGRILRCNPWSRGGIDPVR